jgi:hypothetical protein
MRAGATARHATVPMEHIETKLADHLHPLIASHPLVASLFECFGVTGPSVDRAATELDRLKGNRFASVRS